MTFPARRHRRRRHLAFTIPELLFAIGVLGIFALAATRLFHSTMRISFAAAEQQDAAGSFESALAALRADAWSAGEIASPDPATARLGKVTWSVKETTLSRDAGDGCRPRTWPAPAGVSFAAEGATLVLRLPPPKSGERGNRDVRVVRHTLLLSRLTS